MHAVRTRTWAPGWHDLPIETSAALQGAWAGPGGRVCVVGKKGTVLVTDNHGDAWASAPVPTTEDLVAVGDAAEGSIVAVGAHRTILESDDRGSSWRTVAVAGEAALYAVAATRSATFVTGDVLLRRLRGETTWEAVDTGLGPGTKVLRVGTAPDGRLYACARLRRAWFVLGSDDNGATWRRTPLKSRFGLNTPRYVNGYVLIPGDPGVLWRTTDRGVTWTATAVPDGRSSPMDVCLAPGVWYLLDASGGFYRSTDDGVTWTEVFTTRGTQNQVVASSAGWIYLVGGHGWVIRGADPAFRREPGQG